MSSDDQGKKVRRIAAIIYLLIMAFLVGGSYIAQQRKQANTDRIEEGLVPDRGYPVYSEQ